MTEVPFLVLLAWGTVAGLDLASVLQGLLNRPLVAGGVAGVLIGDPGSGFAIGAVLELFALDVLPVGSARYPDYGAAAVAAVAFGAWQPWTQGLGPAVLLGLLVGQLGGWAVVAHRRLNAWVLRRVEDRLDRGEPGLATRLHLIGLAGDLLRSAAQAGLGLGLAALLRQAPRLDPATGRALALVVIGGGLMAVVAGALRRAGTAQRILWFTGGLAIGAASLGLR
jgi:mannose/fructose/N-acetylgalactosamine-specific phosphotransferase system component IIC